MKKKLHQKNKKHILNRIIDYGLKWIGVETSSLTEDIYLGHKEIIVGIGMFFLSFWIYLKTLTPTIGLLDSGDMITSSYVLGVAHPPGYPFYCLIGKFFSLFPLANIGFRINIFSAFVAAIAVMMITFITSKVLLMDIKQHPVVRGFSLVSKDIKSQKRDEPSKKGIWQILIPPIISGGMLLTASTFWQQAVIAEKYTLNVCFATLIMFAVIKIQERFNPQSRPQSISYLYLTVFLLGLSFSHHFQTIFFLPGVIFVLFTLIWQRRRHSRIPISRWIINMGLIFLIPITLYFYLPIRASANPFANWGNPDTLEQFIRHITAKQYGYYFSSSIIDLLTRLFSHLSKFFSHQFTWVGVIIGLIGMVAMVRLRLLFIFFILVILADIFQSIRYTIPNIEDYYMPAFAIFSIWIGYGIYIITKYHRFLKYLVWFGISLPIISGMFHFHSSNYRHYYFAYDFGRNILSPLEERAILFTSGDDISFPIWYHLAIEKSHRDIILTHMNFMHYDWYAKLLKEIYPNMCFTASVKSDETGIATKDRVGNIINNNIDKRPIYIIENEFLPNNYSLIPDGIYNRVIIGSLSKPDLQRYFDEHPINFVYRGFYDEAIFKDERAWVIAKNYAVSYANLGNAFMDGLGMYDKAVIEYKEAIHVYRESEDARHNLAVVYFKMGRYQEAQKIFNEVLAKNPEFIKIYPEAESFQKALSDTIAQAPHL